MDGTKIDWADSTWNPVTGCLHRCSYCYAQGIVKRYGCKGYPMLKNGDYAVCNKDYKFNTLGAGDIHLFELDKPLYQKTEDGKIVKAPYPFQFRPTLHRYRMIEYTMKQNPRDIFVCSMADLLGDWVPEGWIHEVFEACKASPHHRYLFLTKNTERYHALSSQGVEWPENAWAGFSATGQDDLEDMALDSQWLPKQCFVSIEPIHGPIDLTRIDVKGRGAFINLLNGDRSWMFGGDQAGAKLKWVIVGAETGNRKEKVIPEREWIMSIKRQCQEAGVSLWMKESLRELMGPDFSQDKPWWNG